MVGAYRLERAVEFDVLAEHFGLERREVGVALVGITVVNCFVGHI